MSDETPIEPTGEGVSTPPPPPPDVVTPAPLSQDLATPPPPTGAVADPTAPSKGKRTLALVVAALVVLAAGGAAFAFVQLRGSSDSLMKQIPASADIVATVYLNPAASQKVDLFRMTGKFPALGSETDLTQRVNTMLDQTGSFYGLNHNDFSWIGSQIAVVVDFAGAGTPNVEFLINVDDVNAAKATLQKVRNSPTFSGSGWSDSQYKGVTVTGSRTGGASYAFVGNTLVLANTATGIDSVIDTDQGAASLADSADFTATSSGLPDGRLAFVYVNVQSLLPLLQSTMTAAGVGSGPLNSSFGQLQAVRGFGMTISAQSDGLAMDINEAMDPSKLTDSQKAAASSSHENTLTPYVPSQAFGLLQMERVDSAANSLVSALAATNPSVASQLAAAGVTGPNGLLNTLSGDLTLEVGPGTPGLPVSGALVLGVKDPTVFASAVSKLKDLVSVNTVCTQGSAIATITRSPSPLSSGGGGLGTTYRARPKCHSTPAPDWQTETYKGTTINFISQGGTASVAYATTGSVGLIGIGPDSIKAVIDAKSGSNISTSPTFEAVKKDVPSQGAFFYLDVQGVLKAAAAGSPTSSSTLALLKPVQAIAMGEQITPALTHTKILVLIP